MTLPLREEVLGWIFDSISHFDHDDCSCVFLPSKTREREEFFVFACDRNQGHFPCPQRKSIQPFMPMDGWSSANEKERREFLLAHQRRNDKGAEAKANTEKRDEIKTKR